VRFGSLLLAAALLGCEPGSELLINGHPFAARLDFGALELGHTGELGVSVENRGERTWLWRDISGRGVP
jgi:hypothetical protein